YHTLVPEAVGSMSRTYYDEATNEILAAFTYPGVVPHVGAMSLKDGHIRRLADVKGAVLYKVASFPYDRWYVVASFDYGFVPYDLDISADGRMLSASVSEVNGDQYLRVWDLGKLLAGD